MSCTPHREQVCDVWRGSTPTTLQPADFGFVGQERSQLGEGPGVQPSTLRRTALLDADPNVGQVLHDERGAWRNRLHEPLAENVVAIPPKPCRPTAQTTQSSFRSGGAFSLELTTQPERALFDGPPLRRAVKGVVGGDRRPIEARSMPTMAPESSNKTAGRVTTACSQNLPWRTIRSALSKPVRLLQQCGCMRVGREPDHLPTTGRGQAGSVSDHPVGASVVADRHHRPSRARHLPTMLLEGQGRRNRLTRSHPCRHHQLRRQCWMFGSQIVVGRFVQFHAVALLVLPPIRSDGVEAFRGQSHRFEQCCSLLNGRLEPESNRPLHAHILHDFDRKERLVCSKCVRAQRGAAFLCQLRQAVSSLKH